MSNAIEAKNAQKGTKAALPKDPEALTSEERAYCTACQLADRGEADLLNSKQQEGEELAALGAAEIGTVEYDNAKGAVARRRQRIDVLDGRFRLWASECARARLALRKADSRYADSASLDALIDRVEKFDAAQTARQSVELAELRAKVSAFNSERLSKLISCAVVLNAELESLRAPGVSYLPDFAALPDDPTKIALAIRALLDRIVDDLASQVFRDKLREAGTEGLLASLRSAAGYAAVAAENRSAGQALRMKQNQLERLETDAALGR